MPVFVDSQQLYDILKLLFGQLRDSGKAAKVVQDTRISIRIRCTHPEAEVLIDGRKNPLQVTYGSSPSRPDLDVELTADALHQILMGQLRLRHALAGRQMKVRGALWKTPALEAVLHQIQAIYPTLRTG